MVRTAVDPGSTAAEIRVAVRDIDPLIPIPREQTMQEIVSEAVAPRRFVVTLGALFAGFATFLAALGLYGVISLSVAQRTHEIGIRISLGARRWDVLRMVLSRGLKLALGLAVGIACAIPLARLIASLLYGVKPGRSRKLRRRLPAAWRHGRPGELYSRSARNASGSDGHAALRMTARRWASDR